MKNIYFLLIVLVFCFNSCKTTKPLAENKPAVITKESAIRDVAPPVTNFSDQTTWILGYFNLSQLTRDPHASWYIKGFDEYFPVTDAINKLLEISKDSVSIKIVLGTWCPDSRREVPRFMRVLDIWQFPVDKVTFIGVDDAKRSPVGEYVSLNIQLVPTFIIYKNNVETGRIIENPTTSLEQDMVNILTGMNNNK
jgi:thiol-disulfide isomerase/thioredoxin